MASKKYDMSSFLKLRYAIDPKADTFFEWEGSVFTFIPGEPPKKLFKCVGMNVSKATIEEGKLKATGKELTYYLDPTTGEKLNKWDNPWTGEKDLPVLHIANDPVQMAFPSFLPLETRQKKFNNTTVVVAEIPISYPNILATQDHKFDVFDSNTFYEAGEFFTFKCNTDDLDGQETIDHIEINWTRISKFAPFMKMGDKQQGYLAYHCTGFKLPQGSTFKDLTHPLLVKEIEERMTSYAKAAVKYDVSKKNVTSWTYFKDHFDVYEENDPNTVWPLATKESSSS